MSPVLLDIPDYKTDFKAWLLAQPQALTYHGGRVYRGRLPANNNAWPAVVFYRSGGGKQPGEPNVLNVRFGIEILGGDISAAQESAVEGLADCLESAIDTISMVQQGGTMFLNGIVTSAPDKPDPDTGRPGRVLDAVLTLRSATS